MPWAETTGSSFTRTGPIGRAVAALILLAVAQVPDFAAAEDLLEFTKVGTHPSDRELSGENADSEEANGLAFDGTNWFYATKLELFRLSREFRDSDRSFDVSAHEFDGVRCTHAGGIDAYDGELYVALDNCSDDQARLAVFDADLNPLRSAVLPEMEDSFPWVAVNPMDDAFVYAVSSRSKRILRAFPRRFDNRSVLYSRKKIHFADNPDDVAEDFWVQGGAFSPNGLFFRVVDDGEDNDSDHTGVWVYELGHPVRDGGTARRVGFIHILYTPDFHIGLFGRNYELEDLDVSSIPAGPMAGDVHIIMLSNELGEDDVSILHFASGDYDGDGVKDVSDNCVWKANPGQGDVDEDGAGNACDKISDPPDSGGKCGKPHDLTVWVNTCSKTSRPHEGFKGSPGCSNKLDDDGDGLCDGEDPDCAVTEKELRYTEGCCKLPAGAAPAKEVWAEDDKVCIDGWDNDGNGRCDELEPACKPPKPKG